MNAEIAKNRYAKQGVTLISPPPHHDIYSIEDLAQLIYDLKRVNKTAQVCVKLVSTSGVGTIAAGVVKAYADVVQISGMDGGTGASPLSSIKNAGINWELGLAETQQVLVANGLRERVVLRVDGGLKDGRDVVLGALLGAEQFGFGTAALVALGCVMARKCQLNTCPVGIATQDPELRKKFKGQPEHVVTFLIHTAEQVRHVLASLGVKTLDEVVGRVDLLKLKEKALFPKGAMDLSALLVDPDPSRTLPRKAKSEFTRNDPDAARAHPQVREDSEEGAQRVLHRIVSPPTLVLTPLTQPPYLLQEGMDLDDVVWRTCASFVDSVTARLKAGEALPPLGSGDHEAAGIDLHFPISNAARSVGARLSGEIARRLRNAGLPGDGRITLTFHGVAGQSFGAFNSHGVKLVLRGDAHDYVGKSMHGGTIVLSFQSPALPPRDAAAGYHSTDAVVVAPPATSLWSYNVPSNSTNVICGNTCLYGATGGRFFAAGRGGERFAVRNSGATAVVEGTGDNACEYMTNGTVVVLGAVGRNFGAGMSGGRAFVLDLNDTFLDKYNPGMVEPLRIGEGSAEEREVRGLIEEHVRETGSSLGAHLLAHWSDAREHMWHVAPNTTPLKERSQALAHVPLWSRSKRGADALQAPAIAALPLFAPKQQRA